MANAGTADQGRADRLRICRQDFSCAVDQRGRRTGFAGSRVARAIERFGKLIADKLRDPDDAATRQGYVRLLVDKVEIGKELIRITGSRRNWCPKLY